MVKFVRTAIKYILILVLIVNTKTKGHINCACLPSLDANANIITVCLQSKVSMQLMLSGSGVPC